MSLREPAVGVAGLDEVDEVPRSPEQEPGEPRACERRVAPRRRADERDESEQGQRNQRRELRRHRQREGQREQDEVEPRPPDEREPADDEEAPDDEVVVGGRRLDRDERQTREHERREQRLPVGHPESPGDPRDRDEERAEGEDLRERGVAVAAREQHRRKDADLGARRVPVQSRVACVRHVGDRPAAAPRSAARARW